MKIKKAGIFQNQPIGEINRIAKACHLDYIQLSGDENLEFIRQCKRPVIKGLSIKSKRDLKKAEKVAPHAAYFLLDSAKPGSGKKDHHDLLKKVPFPCLAAGGLNTMNLKKILNNKNLLGIDVASGVETNGIIDFKKIEQLLNLMRHEIA